MKYFFRKWYKLILSVFAGFVNSAGLAISIVQIALGNTTTESIIIYIVLGVSELFLIISVIFSLASIFKNKSEQIHLEEKNNEIDRLKHSDRVIYENQKSSITTYKDCIDALEHRVSTYLDNHKRLNDLEKSKEKLTDNEGIITDYIYKEREKEYDNFKLLLIDDYHRFLGNMCNTVRRSLEEYISTKGCKKGVSITIKQLEIPQNYNVLNDHKAKVYTAFRDFRTYYSKQRIETWGKAFTISKNSDFVISIEKDYYIFNFVDKKHLDTGLYQNENSNFYEHYNSGITCTIYSCMNKERKLFGYLACDSLFDKTDRKNIGTDIFDWEAANLMMHAAHIIAMYLQEFFSVWDRYCVFFRKSEEVTNTDSDYKAVLKEKKDSENNETDLDKKEKQKQEIEEIEKIIDDNNFCSVISKAVEKRRYNN